MNGFARPRRHKKGDNCNAHVCYHYMYCTLVGRPARIIFIPVLYIVLSRWAPLFRAQRSVWFYHSHIHLMILGAIPPSSRFLSPAPYSSDR